MTRYDFARAVNDNGIPFEKVVGGNPNVGGRRGHLIDDEDAAVTPGRECRSVRPNEGMRRRIRAPLADQFVFVHAPPTRQSDAGGVHTGHELKNRRGFAAACGAGDVKRRRGVVAFPPEPQPLKEIRHKSVFRIGCDESSTRRRAPVLRSEPQDRTIGQFGQVALQISFSSEPNAVENVQLWAPCSGPLLYFLSKVCSKR